MRGAILIALLLAGCGDSGVELGWSRQQILDGVDDSGHPAVGLLRNVFCTATLVGSRTILTAAHCLQQGGPYSIELEGKIYEASKVVPHPEWRTEEGALPECEKPDWKFSVADLGLLLLDRPVLGVTPMRLARRTPAVGDGATLVGFGVTADGSSGTKHRAENVLGCVGGTLVLFGTIGGLGGGPGLTCTGDSGGPVLVDEEGEERVLAVHSMAICGKYTQGTRVAPYLDWLASQADADLGVAADLQLERLRGRPSLEGPTEEMTGEEPLSGAGGCSVDTPGPRLADRAALLVGLLALLVVLIRRGRDLIP